MSRAFVKEDVDPPERSGRVRSASGLPPGALNYMTALGARRLGAKVEELRRANSDPARIAELEAVLASITVVERPSGTGDSVSFRRDCHGGRGNSATYTVVGVDELDSIPTRSVGFRQRAKLFLPPSSATRSDWKMTALGRL